jgi:hypothetical protein
LIRSPCRVLVITCYRIHCLWLSTVDDRYRFGVFVHEQFFWIVCFLRQSYIFPRRAWQTA